VTLNENISSFVGETGAIEYLKSKYGNNHTIIDSVKDSRKDFELYKQHIHRGAKMLDSLYTMFGEKGYPYEEKKQKKDSLIQGIIRSSDTIQFVYPQNYRFLATKNFTPNNAFFISHLMYHQKTGSFQQLFETQCSSNLKCFVQQMKAKYGDKNIL
jgi:hypothetical protein